MNTTHNGQSNRSAPSHTPRLLRFALLAMAPAFPALAQLTTIQKLPPAAISPALTTIKAVVTPISPAVTTTVKPAVTPISPTLTTAIKPTATVTAIQPLPPATISPVLTTTVKTTVTPISPTLTTAIKPTATVTAIQPLPTATLSPTLTTAIKPTATVTAIQPLPSATLSPTLTTAIKPTATVTAIQPLPSATLSPTLTTAIGPTVTATTIQPLPSATISPSLTATINPTALATIQPAGLPTPALPPLQTITLQPAVLSPAATGLAGIGAATFLPAATAPAAPVATTTRIIEPAPTDVVAGGLGALVAPGAGKGELVGAAVKRGQIGARDTMTLDLYGDQLVSFAVSDAVAEQITRTVGAGGGQVVLSAGAAKAVVDNVVNLGGKIKADVVVMIGDKLVLSTSEELAAADARTSRFADFAAKGGTLSTAADGTTAGQTGLARGPTDWAGVIADANLPFASSVRFPGASVPTLGPAAFDSGLLTPRFLHTPPAGWTPPPGGATVMYSIHRPGGSGGGLGPSGPSNLNPGLGGTFPPGTIVARAATHRPGGNSGGPDATPGSAGPGRDGGAAADAASAGHAGFGGVGQGGGKMVVALTEIVPSAFDLSEEASPAHFVLTASPGQADGSQGVSGGRGVASVADLGRGSQAGDDAFAGRQHVVEAPGCNSQFAGNTYFTRDVFGRELITVCTLASAAAVSSR